MKILLVTLEYPPQKGGVASYYFGLVEELKRQGNEVEVIPNEHNPSQPPLTLRGGELLGWIWPKWLRGYFTVRAALKKEKFDFLFVGQVLPLGTVAYLLRRRIPYVVFTHGMDVLTMQQSWRKRRIGKKILENAKLVVANSEFTKEVVTEIGVAPERVRRRELSLATPQNVVVYPCPNISPDVKHEDVEVLRRRLGLVGKKVLLTLGRVVERKGHDLVIAALPEILKHVPEAVYVVTGDGPDLPRLQKLVARDFMSRPSGTQGAALQNSVRFVGAISDVDRPLYYALCDLFVMPSRQIGPIRARGRLWRPTSNGIKPDVEGFGLVFLEAALFGKPSIGGRSGGIPEAILDGATGALVDPNDPGAFARVAVQFLHDDALRYELGQNAKARVLHEFRWEKQAEKVVSQL